MSAHFDSRAVTESRIKTSASDAEKTVSGAQGETPHTLKSPLLFNSLARVSRNNRFPATKNTRRILFGTALPGERLGYSGRYTNIMKLCLKAIRRPKIPGP